MLAVAACALLLALSPPSGGGDTALQPLPAEERCVSPGGVIRSVKRDWAFPLPCFCSPPATARRVTPGSNVTAADMNGEKPPPTAFACALRFRPLFTPVRGARSDRVPL